MANYERSELAVEAERGIERCLVQLKLMERY